MISGELDNVTTPAEGKRVAAEFPNSRHYVARGAGHVADLYAPVHSAPAIELRRFLHRALGGKG